jgi:hypothetical protein
VKVQRRPRRSRHRQLHATSARIGIRLRGTRGYTQGN